MNLPVFTLEDLQNAFEKLKQHEAKINIAGIPHYALQIDDIAARKWKRMMKRWDKQDMSNRARRLLRNRRKMK